MRACMQPENLSNSPKQIITAWAEKARAIKIIAQYLAAANKAFDH